MKLILVVDDNVASLKQIGALLADHYDFSLTKSGSEAIAFCEREVPDLVLLDVNMPEMDGFETIARLKKIPSMARVPIIFLTGNINSETEILALEAGAVDYITKPAEKDILRHRMELHLELHEYQTDLENTRKELQNGIVASFADLVECKDCNTGNHVFRTSKLFELLGNELIKTGEFSGELSAENLEIMVQGAPFHDIGKIGISDVILQKPSSLTPDEFEVVKKHPVIGAKVLENIYKRTPDQDYLKYAYLMAGGHHERYDGSGYPDGLVGTNTPLCCRLLSVVNVYDACRGHRLYRPAMDHQTAMAIILEGRGTKFDPTITDVFRSISRLISGLY
ncbi:MAG: response regulator [Deltaproteobacteria bacterium]|jgi:putative two-component system response regulator|nr:response regulator [Deltaproteobacteria bacterium]